MTTSPPPASLLLCLENLRLHAALHPLSYADHSCHSFCSFRFSSRASSPTTPAALVAADQPMDVEITTTQLVVVIAINIQLLILSTSSPSTDVPRDDQRSAHHDLAATNQFIIILDEKCEDKTLNQH
jgi:hypothetical protein